MAKKQQKKPARTGQKIALPIFAATLLAVFIFSLAWKSHHTNSAQGEQAALEKTIEPMLRDSADSGWNLDVVGKYTSPKLTKWFDTSGKAAMNTFRDFGAMTQFDGITKLKATDEHAYLVASAQFEYSPAYIEMDLAKLDDKWMIDSIYIVGTGEESGKIVK